MLLWLSRLHVDRVVTGHVLMIRRSECDTSSHTERLLDDGIYVLVLAVPVNVKGNTCRLSTLYSDAVRLRQWRLAGLPADTTSEENAIMLLGGSVRVPR